MKTITVLAAFLAIAAAQVPVYRTMPVFPKHTAFEWEKIMANQHLPAEDNDLDAVPAGVEPQPESSGMVIPPPEGHIFNGNVAYPGQFPWHAIFFIEDIAFCGGSLISPKTVLTAAHCVQGQSMFTVVMGAHYIQRNETSQVIQVTRKAIYHEKFQRKPKNYHYDIAVLLMDQDFPITGRINTIALPSKSMMSELFEGYTLTVTGYGRRNSSLNMSDVLNYVRLPVISNTKCAEYFGDSIISSKICGDGANGRSPCHGDSGGPFTANKDGKEIVVGIVSFGTGKGCDVGYPSVYTRVTSYLAWIQEKTGIQISQE